MRKLTLLSCFLFFSCLLVGQNVQWAASVMDFSSQRGEEDYAANQVLGAPNAMLEGSNPALSWSPKNENAFLGEYIQVAFAKPMPIQQVLIAESENPGAIERITLYDEANRRHLVYENEVPQPIYKKNRLFQHIFPKTAYAVTSLKIELKTSAITGSNMIDAIGISDSKELPKFAPAAEEMTSKGGSINNAEDLGTQINSPYAERLPIISSDGQVLYFARKYHPQNIGEENNDDIWYATRKPDGTWSKALNIGAPLNTRAHNFVVACSPSGNILYLANDYQSSKKDGVSVSVRKGRTWSAPQPLDIEDHYNDNEFVGYHVGVNGRILLMSVERKEGYGKRDLYVSFHKSGNNWSKPINLGSTINTPDEETSVFLAADGKTIYFASNGRRGLGGLDIYRSQRLDDSWRRWTTPVNLGPAFNTPEHDFNFTIPASGDYAYFSSGPIKNSNLYRIPLPEDLRPEPVTLVTGRIIDKTSNRPVHAQIKYQNLEEDTPASSMAATADGQYKVVVPYGETMGLYAEQKGYFAVSENLKLSAERLEELDYMPDEIALEDDEELEKLQEKYNRLHSEVKELESNKQQAKKNAVIPNHTGSATAFRDPELENLRARYNAAVLKNDKKFIEKAAPKEEEPVTSDIAAVNAEEEMDELSKMKATFNKLNNTKPTEKPEEKIDSRTILQKKQSDDNELAQLKAKFNKANDLKTTNDATISTAPGQASEQSGFDNLEKEVRIELHQELLDDVKLDLQKELLTDAKEEVAEELDTAERSKLQNPTLEKEVKSQYAAAVKANWEEQYREEISAELRTEWEEKIKADLRKALRDEIKAELRRELREEVKAELREALKYQVKKELEAELLEELTTKKTQHTAQPTPSQPIFEAEPEEPFAPVYQEVEQDIILVPIKVGQVIPMNNIFFDANQSSLKDESFSELERVLAFLQKNPNLVVEVGGHTNGWCSHSFANELSDKRAKKVVDYFVEKGITPSKIQHRGYGKLEPIASNDNAEGRRKNQRVELKILEILE